MEDTYEIDINSNYTDIFLLINSKEKLQSFLNYIPEFVVKETREQMEKKEDEFFPVAILNEKGKVIEMDYNTVVKCFTYWSKDVLGFSQWEDIPKIFNYSFLSNSSKPTNQSVFFSSIIFGMFHRATSVGFDFTRGVTGYKHLHAVPIIYKSNATGELMQYAALTFYIKKINDVIKDNNFEEDFKQALDYSSEAFTQIAFGIKKCKDEWGAEQQNHYEV